MSVRCNASSGHSVSSQRSVRGKEEGVLQLNTIKSVGS